MHLHNLAYPVGQSDSIDIAIYRDGYLLSISQYLTA